HHKHRRRHTGRANFCTPEQEKIRQCPCCKVRCWSSVQHSHVLSTGRSKAKNTNETIEILTKIEDCA
uniref:Uncharacterized protein n=1 Tax=Romanomermis culicivorax TaxID=13658 RepID=A0A915KW32_ROMCU